ncbi:MAG TPA: hypothetical protein EYQ74_09060 [Planctomycetes bacterium]|nr:hypothetical protein [Planctomycetota bacterium]HIK59883.1 hypothetical protein [Planctomycetota bacterium]
MLAALLALPLLLSPGQDEPSRVPIQVRTVMTPCTDQGTFILRLECTPTEKLDRDFALRVALTLGVEDLLQSDHEIKPGTRTWTVGETVDLAFPLALPDGLILDGGELVAIRLGFTSGNAVHAPSVDGYLIDPDGLADLDFIDAPRFVGAAGAQRLKEVFAQGKALRKDDPPAAWRLLSQALRDAADEKTKELVRDALIEVGRYPSAAPSEGEGRVVAQRIRAEQVRVFRLEAGRMAARGHLHGALRLLEEVGGALALDADEAVIGAVNEARRATERIDDLRERILTELNAEQEEAVKAAVEEQGRTEDLLKYANELADGGERLLALALYRNLRRFDGIDLYDSAQERLEAVGAAHLAATPPDDEELVRAVREHPAWERTGVSGSHEFLYIGPRELVERIPEPSRLRFDLAYVFLTDLFGRRPNPEGERVTVYFKELWDFGGGVGGGKIINIGKAQPAPKKPVRVDNGLLYHELTHCIDDTSPVTGGFHEGLANLGAAYAHEALDQDGDALHSFEGNLGQFEDYYLARDLPFWRIQNYGPSAGFFLSFLEAYTKLGKHQHDWTPLRRFFREYREAPIRDGREMQVPRALAHYLGRAFGPKVFDDLVRYRFPLIEADRRQLFEEFEAYELESIDDFSGAFAERPNSPLPRDLTARDLNRYSTRNDLKACERLRGELGVVFDWKVIGPFFAAKANPLACVFPPELEIDFSKKPRSLRASRADYDQRVWQDPWPGWRQTSSHKNVELMPTGWLRFDYRPYGDDHSAIYALTHVTVEADSEAVAHLRANDDVVLFVNDVRAGSYRGHGSNGSTERWRGPHLNLPDAIRMPITLRAGRNKVLVKIRNHGGGAGMSLALADPDGSPLAFSADAAAPDPVGLRKPVDELRHWKRLALLDYRSFRSKAKQEVGSFRASNKEFSGTDTGKGVAWRQWTVRPGFPKDSPSNLLWVKETITRKLGDAVRVRIEFASTAAPKVLVTVQGEGNRDGLSGWNLILVPHGADRVAARLERYDRLVYESDPMDLPAAEDGRELVLTLWRGWATATIDGVVLLDRVSIRSIPDRTRIGLATWGTNPRFREVEIFEGR